ncbi:unnamed protein product [Citrullus colocynthis]|uniref:Uncharacterized protein n=1 Tax=Citrullus colocynthis TaxID=252529 RepID=A0ABP0XW15_9ROSI
MREHEWLPKAVGRRLSLLKSVKIREFSKVYETANKTTQIRDASSSVLPTSVTFLGRNRLTAVLIYVRFNRSNFRGVSSHQMCGTGRLELVNLM